MDEMNGFLRFVEVVSKATWWAFLLSFISSFLPVWRTGFAVSLFITSWGLIVSLWLSSLVVIFAAWGMVATIIMALVTGPVPILIAPIVVAYYDGFGMTFWILLISWAIITIGFWRATSIKID